VVGSTAERVSVTGSKVRLSGWLHCMKHKSLVTFLFGRSLSEKAI